MFGTIDKTEKERFLKATGFRADKLGKPIIGNDLRQGSTMMQSLLHHSRSVVDHKTSLSIYDFLPVLRKEPSWSAAVFKLNGAGNELLYGMRQQDAEILAVGSKLRRTFGDWRKTAQKEFPNNEILHRSSLFQTIAYDTGLPVGSSSVYRDRHANYLRLSAVWRCLSCRETNHPVIVAVIAQEWL